MTTPSTPIQLEDALHSSLGGGAASRGGVYSTPGRGSHQRHHSSDLTPVISNSNSLYVDNHHNPNSNKRGGSMMPGLTISEGSEGIIGPRGTSDGRSRMPLPRAGLPPAKRSSMENPSPNESTVPSSSASSIGAAGEQGISLTSTLLSVGGSEAKDGLGGLIGERLAMPSCGSLYSEEDAASLSSTDDSSGPVRGVMRLSSSGSRHSSSTKNSMSEGPPSIFKKKKDDGQQQLAPIELKPDRKFFSFQGASQYKQAVEDADTSSTRLETIVSPSRPSMGGGQPMLSTMNQGPHQVTTPQYQPSLRNQHGVTEMADTKDLNAIFKAPRNTTQGANTAGPSPKVVSPGTPAASIATMTTASSMMQEASVGHSAAAVDQHLQQTYPVDDRQWSIPSIRMAKHINLSSNNLSAYNHGSYASFSEYTDDDGSLDESYYSFLGDDDDASLSSRGSVDPVVRRRRFLRASMEMASSQAANVAENVDGSLGGSADSSSQPPAIGQSNSFIEKIQGISIENNTDTTMMEGTTPSAIPPHLSKRANTFDSEIMMVDDTYGDNTNVGGGLDINGPPPILNVHSSTSQGGNAAMDDADYHQSRRRHRHRGRGRRRREGAAMGWIQELQSQTNDAQLITESASSKFMAATSNTAGGSTTQTNNFGMTSEDVTKALGMPHPLCRSSTIEAGPFTIGIHREMGFGNSGSGGDIALNSSGSGESPPVGAF